MLTVHPRNQIPEEDKPQAAEKFKAIEKGESGFLVVKLATD